MGRKIVEKNLVGDEGKTAAAAAGVASFGIGTFAGVDHIALVEDVVMESVDWIRSANLSVDEVEERNRHVEMHLAVD